VLGATAVWLTWERQRRNRSMAAALDVPLIEIDGGPGRLRRYGVCAKRTLQVLQRRKPAVIFAQNPSLVLAAIVTRYGRTTGTPVIIDAHNAGIFPFEEKRGWANRLCARVIRDASLTIVSNDGLVPTVRERGGRAFVLPDPLPAARRKSCTAPMLRGPLLLSRKLGRRAMAEVIAEPPGVAVQSRVSWGALLAGAAVGVATYTVLALLGVAVGLTVVNGAAPENVGIGTGIWAFVSLVIAMFFAGWVTTQCTVGETQTEAVLYGVVVWAVTATVLVWTTAAGMGMGAAFLTMGQPERLAMAPQPGVDAEPMRDPVAAMQDPQARAQLQALSWWTFFGTVISLAAAIGGALLGPYEFVARRTTRRRRAASE
jgi:hypothetical protein